MSSAKTERLVNLTMALLATQRYMRKSEIFRKVAGYGGSEETKERMFERDKDDLRALGIEIEVASHDPLFEDEPGYRIRPDTYRMPAADFSLEEMGILTTALGLWLDSGLEDLAVSAARRFRSFGEINGIDISGAPNTSAFSEAGLLELTKALAQRSQIDFDYKKPDSAKAESRSIFPLGLSAWKGSWYLVGEDLNRDDIRVFKVSRITSTIEVAKKRDMYQIPEDFNVRDYLVMHTKEELRITAIIMKGRAHSVRSKTIAIEPLSDSELSQDWERITYSAENLEGALREALWYSDSLIVQSPENLRQGVIESLTQVVAHHG
jgi:proteasome accessory factor B